MMNESLLGVVSWFPQDYALHFYVFKGVLAVAATCLVVGHMMHTWSDVSTFGRRLRYFALLAVTALMAFASTEQVHEAELVSYRNLGAVVALTLVLWAMVVSIREDFRRKP